MFLKKVLKPAQKRGLATEIHDDYKVSLRRSCDLVILQRTVYYYQSRRRVDTALRMRLVELSQIRVRYGIGLEFESW